MTAPERQPISQPSPPPTTKVTAGKAAGVVSVELMYIPAQIHLVVAGEVGSALTVIFTASNSYVGLSDSPEVFWRYTK